MSDIYFDEISAYSADVWPSVAIGMPEVQAHVMSYPQAQGEYDVDDHVRELQAEVQRLSAELTHRTEVWEGEEFKLRGDLSEARAEVERLKESLAEEHDKRVQQAITVYRLASEIERLLKEREDAVDKVVGANGCVVGDYDRNNSGDKLRKALIRAGDLIPLDHRLGLPQPDGEPVAPMSAKKPYRWGIL